LITIESPLKKSAYPLRNEIKTYIKNILTNTSVFDKIRLTSRTEEKAMIIGYARVSTQEQNLDRQLAAFAALGASERDIITDKESGKDLDRKGYITLKAALLRRGDTLVVKSLDRLSRNKADIKNELQYFHDNGIRLKVLDLPTTMMDFPAGQEWVFR
jgi:predicted site-specific integrase-resolvase